MPFPVSIPMALVFLWLIHPGAGCAAESHQWVNPMTAGFMAGYLVYDLTHYATHHFTMRNGYARYIKRYHMAHHYKSPTRATASVPRCGTGCSGRLGSNNFSV